MSANAIPRLAWLDRYASTDQKYQWQVVPQDGGTTLIHRPLGLVELVFDTDGRYYEGRADINALATLDVRTRLDKRQIRERILNAWSRVRLEHALLRAKALRVDEFLPGSHGSPRDIHFVVEKPHDEAALQAETAETIVFMDDFYDYVDPREFYRHTQNVARIVNPDKFLAKLFVFPLEPCAGSAPGSYVLRIQMTAAHQITEGLTMRNWWAHFLVLLNDPPSSSNLEEHYSLKAVEDRFPLAQETLYHPISQNLARQRWFWAMTIVLRHVHTPVPEGFRNPLRRAIPLESAVPMKPTFDTVLDYSRTPPLNTFTASFSLSRRATGNLHRLCREAGVSIGAGSFALAGLASMELHEARFPDIPLDHRQPFVASFPLNPRAMFAMNKPPDSLMLAFSEGLALPFLPSYLQVEGRLKLLARRADEQLRAYQKRVPKTMQERVEKDTRRIIANNYLASIERGNMVFPAELREEDDISTADPQGAYPRQVGIGRATHGVSSIGVFGGLLTPGTFSLDAVGVEGGKDFAADCKGLAQGVRARNDEFLCGMGGNQDYLGAVVSFDGNAIDEELLEQWKEKLERLLDFEDGSKL